MYFILGRKVLTKIEVEDLQVCLVFPSLESLFVDDLAEVVPRLLFELW